MDPSDAYHPPFHPFGPGSARFRWIFSRERNVRRVTLSGTRGLRCDQVSGQASVGVPPLSRRSVSCSRRSLGVQVAVADTAPVDPAESLTYAADSLPTVQIDGVVWDQAIVGNHGLRGR